MARIQALPLEMLVLVFTFVVRKHFDDKDGARPPVLGLRAVCRLWRDIVNDAEPSLWSIIPLDDTTITQEFISRCRNRPIHIYLRGRSNALNSKAKPEALDLVLRQRSQQISTLSLADLAEADAAYGRAAESLQTGSFPGLRTLEVLRTDYRLRDELFSGPIPTHLHILRFDLNGGGLHQLHRVLSLCPLTVLELRRIDIQALALSTLMDTLSELVHLQDLVIEVTGHRETVLAPRQADRSVVLARLRNADISADLPDLLLLLRPLNIPPSARMSISCLHRSSTAHSTSGDDFQDLKTLQTILRAHFAPILSQDFHFTELTVESNLCGRSQVAGALILGGPQASGSFDMPKRFVFRYRIRLLSDESIVDRSFATFYTLLSCVPALGRTFLLFVKSPCLLDPERFSDIFAAAPQIAAIVVDDIYAKHLFWALQSTFPAPLLPNLQGLVLHKVRLTERVAYNTVTSTAEGLLSVRAPPMTVGDLLLLCLDSRRGHGSEKWRISLRDCNVLEDHVQILRQRFSSRFIWDGKGACKGLPSLP